MGGRVLLRGASQGQGSLGALGKAPTCSALGSPHSVPPPYMVLFFIQRLEQDSGRRGFPRSGIVFWRCQEGCLQSDSERRRGSNLWMPVGSDRYIPLDQCDSHFSESICPRTRIVVLELDAMYVGQPVLYVCDVRHLPILSVGQASASVLNSLIFQTTRDGNQAKQAITADARVFIATFAQLARIEIKQGDSFQKCKGGRSLCMSCKHGTSTQGILACSLACREKR